MSRDGLYSDELTVTEVWQFSRDGASDRRDLVVTLPIRTVSEANARGHWAKKARRAKEQRRAVGLVLAGALKAGDVRPPCTVTIARIGPSNGLDGDNLQTSLKACRDGIADALGVNDNDPRVTWCYAQRRGKRGEWAVEVRVRTGRPA